MADLLLLKKRKPRPHLPNAKLVEFSVKRKNVTVRNAQLELLLNIVKYHPEFAFQVYRNDIFNDLVSHLKLNENDKDEVIFHQEYNSVPRKDFVDILIKFAKECGAKKVAAIDNGINATCIFQDIKAVAEYFEEYHIGYRK